MRKTIEHLAAALGRSKGKKRVLAVGGALCLAAWATFGMSMALGIGAAAQVALLSVALVITDVLFWAAAALLGMTVVQLRRRMVGNLLPGRRDDAA
ncbi:hypothetical protein [Stenotrophomonas rhizophila]|uniref:hypothetical protein n=1 Tax=Stenotrophomonas rhizophila TaxID=216778 RepID=UPI0028B0FA4E|nr:hypothetical protein [Stenotrophomonas rhizophila]